MHMEVDRIVSFGNWPGWSRLNIGDLAKAGFYYDSQLRTTRCFSCYLEIQHWTTDQNPWREHRWWSPRCRFIMNLPAGNVAIDEDIADIPTPPRVHSHEYVNLRVSPTVSAEPAPTPTLVSTRTEVTRTTNTVTSLHSTTPAGTLELVREISNVGDATICRAPQGPTHPQYQQYDDRVRTYGGFPESTGQVPEYLAEAGFFYSKMDDLVICFYCGKGLKDWEPVDDPWEEHAKWHQACLFLDMAKGRKYIRSVRYPTSPAPKEPPTSENENKEKETTKPDIPEFLVCKICCQQEITTMVLPCGHLISCRECAEQLKKCGVCRKRIQYRVRAYFS